MKGKQLGYVLIAVIIIGIVGLGSRVAATVTDSELPVLTGLRTLTPENIDMVVMRDWENEVTLIKREDGTWWSDNYPVVQTKLTDFWGVSGDIEGSELIATNPKNHKEMGVSQEFATLVQYWKSGELQEEFLVGDKQFVGKSAETAFFLWDVYVRTCFIRKIEQDDVYGVACQFPQQFDARSRYWKDPIVIQIPREDVAAVSFADPGGQFDVQVMDSVWMVGSGDDRVRANITLVQDMLKNIEMLVARDFPTEEQIDGLDFSKPDITVTIVTKPDSQYSSSLLLVIEDSDGGYWGKTSDSSYIYYFLDRDINNLLLTRDELESR